MDQPPADVTCSDLIEIEVSDMALIKEATSVPLEICYPTPFTEKVLRRSPRLSSSPNTASISNVGSKRKFKMINNGDCGLSVVLRRSLRHSSGSSLGEIRGPRDSKKAKNGSKQGELRDKFFDQLSVRRSPRFISSPTDTLNGISKSNLAKIQHSRDEKLKNTAKKPDWNMTYLRRSPRFSSPSSGTGSSSSKATKEHSKNTKCMEDMGMRRSPKMSSSPSMEDNKKGTLYSKKHDLKSFDEKHLRSSRSCPVDHCGNVRELPSRKSDEPAHKKIKASLKESEPRVIDKQLSEECLMICTSLSRNKDANRNMPGDPVELPTPTVKHPSSKGIKVSTPLKKKRKNIYFLFGDPIPSDEAQEKWHWRYDMKTKRSRHPRIALEDDDDEDKIVWNVESHYSQANVDGNIFYLGDCAYIEGDGGEKHIGRIIEFFRTTDGEDYFRVQWFYRAEDTVMKGEAAFHEHKRVFYSTVMNDNPLECIISKVSVTKISPRVGLKSSSTLLSDFYFDMEYCVEYSTFRTLPTDTEFSCYHSSLPNCTKLVTVATVAPEKASCDNLERELALLDLYSGCGGMSTGLCLGAKVSGVDLVTRWALDSDKSACESVKLNHPETLVRNETAEDFLELLKEWEKLCKRYASSNVRRIHRPRSMPSSVTKENIDCSRDSKSPDEEYEVSSIVDVCYGDPDESGKRGLKLKVRWEGYDASEDTWEPLDGLSNCQDRIREFVRDGFKFKFLPLPGDVDVICGGPPCQGISGYNRYRNVDSPLDDERNRQIIVFMDIVQFLRPKYVLMENVVDLLRFDNASLGRYALSRLVDLKYQARLGTIAAGCYGLPQFRLRVFLWGARPTEKLPQFPLPTHEVIVRYWPPPEFERNTVGYDEGQPRQLEKEIVLQDAISDLPKVTSHETREEMPYERPPESEFQRYIRSTKDEMTGSAFSGSTRTKYSVYDHRPLPCTEDEYIRISQIPKRKGANFRDLPGVVVGDDKVVRRDVSKKQMLLPSGKPLVPDWALSFEHGKSKRPFARLWWDETVPTLVTFPNCHSQAMLHPEQDRILTIREYARLQGFPDYYRFFGTVKHRYRQIGNAVAVPVARALGYALGIAFQKQGGDEPLLKLPQGFSHSTYVQLTKLVVGTEKYDAQLTKAVSDTEEKDAQVSIIEKEDDQLIKTWSETQIEDFGLAEPMTESEENDVQLEGSETEKGDKKKTVSKTGNRDMQLTKPVSDTEKVYAELTKQLVSDRVREDTQLMKLAAEKGPLLKGFSHSTYVQLTKLIVGTEKHDAQLTKSVSDTEEEDAQVSIIEKEDGQLTKTWSETQIEDLGLAEPMTESEEKNVQLEGSETEKEDDKKPVSKTGNRDVQLTKPVSDTEKEYAELTKQLVSDRVRKDTQLMKLAAESEKADVQPVSKTKGDAHVIEIEKEDVQLTKLVSHTEKYVPVSDTPEENIQLREPASKTEKEEAQVSETEKEDFQVSEIEKEDAQESKTGNGDVNGSKTKKQELRVSEIGIAGIQESETKKENVRASNTEKEDIKKSETAKEDVQKAATGKQDVEASETENGEVEAPEPETKNEKVQVSEIEREDAEACKMEKEDVKVHEID